MRHCETCLCDMEMSIKANKDFKKALEIVKEVSREYGIPARLILGKRRNRPIAEARFEAMLRVYERLELPLKTIGLLFGGRDHSTVVNALNRAEDAREERTVLSRMRLAKGAK